MLGRYGFASQWCLLGGLEDVRLDVDIFKNLLLNLLILLQVIQVVLGQATSPKKAVILSDVLGGSWDFSNYL